MSREEDAYVIERMGKLLAEIAIVVNGPEPPLTSWSYHDLPAKVRALKEAQRPAAAVPEGYVLVPVEPTEEMLVAALDQALGDIPRGLADWMIRSVLLGHIQRQWAAMLAATNKENSNG